jgi:molybdopterin molybdotransferase
MDGCRGAGLIGVRDALAALDAVRALPTRSMRIERALHRVLAEPARAACDLPPFTQSAVDGYALRHADLAVGLLSVAGIVRAASLTAAPQLLPGTAQRIYTGGMLPIGADTVLRQEWAQIDRQGLRATRVPAPGADLRSAGEELRAGTVVAAAGARLTPGLVAALSAAGVAEVAVRNAPRIAVLVTGDEVAAPGSARQLGQVADANGPLVTTWLAAQGYDKVRLEYVADSPAAVRGTLERAFQRCDLVLSTGGVSVGDHDHVPPIAGELGARTLFWKVAQKPGKPVFAALHGRVPLLGLPGNPASVLVNLVTYARRALDLLEGARAPGPAFRTGVVDAAVRPDADRDQWLRMALRHDEAGRAVLVRLPKQGSHMLSNLADAGALAWIPASQKETPAGTVVRWLAL